MTYTADPTTGRTHADAIANALVDPVSRPCAAIETNAPTMNHAEMTTTPTATSTKS